MDGKIATEVEGYSPPSSLSYDGHSLFPPTYGEDAFLPHDVPQGFPSVLPGDAGGMGETEVAQEQRLHNLNARKQAIEREMLKDITHHAIDVCGKSTNVRKPPALIQAVWTDNATTLTTLITAKAQTDIADIEFGVTALGWAARRGYDTLVRKLLEQ